ncbi:MAG: hypothetical protein ABFS86_01570 [Planctomycetota bacterium]
MRTTRGLATTLFLALAVAGPVAAEGTFRIEVTAENQEKFHTAGSTIETVERADGTPVFRWQGAKESPIAVLSIRILPDDLSAFRTLRLNARATPALNETLYVRFVAEDGFLSGSTAAPATTEWKPVEIGLPDMRADSGFDPASLTWLQFSVICPEGFTIEFDGIELVEAGAGWRYSPEEEAARQIDPRFLVGDFEPGSAVTRFRAGKGKAFVVASKKPAGRVLRWTLEASNDGGWLDFVNLPEDLTPYRYLRFRARFASGGTDGLYVRFRADEATVGALLPAIGEEWTEVEIPLPEMRMTGELDPAKVLFLRLVCFRSTGHELDIDDIALVKDGDGWRYSVEDRREMGIDPAAPSFRIADFDRRNALAHVSGTNSEIEVLPVKKGRRSRGQHLRWSVKKGSKRAGVTFVRIPSDLRDYRTLRFRARINRMPAGRLSVCFQCMKGVLGRDLATITKRWQEFEVPLPHMASDEEFNVEAVAVCRFFYYGDAAFTLDLDDIELVKGAGGWKLTEDEQVAFVFGSSRAKKVRKIDTDHFFIWTDSAAARKKFPKALEKTHDFVCRELGMEEIPGRLPVYIFQNSNLYFDFCVRKGWSREAAEATAGHAGRTYFATYYQAPNSATVTHELTHSIVNRTFGTGGGSWFQEGIAVHVELRWKRSSAAEGFAPRLRSGEFVPLAEFLKIDRLIGEDDVKGGPRTSHWLYAQAGAFFEFLLRGPYRETAPGRVNMISVLDTDEGDVVAEVEKILGRSIEQIEEDWIAWGSAPPKAKRK